MKRLTPQHQQLLVAAAEVRQILRDLIYTSDMVPATLLGPLADRLTAGMKARRARRKPGKAQAKPIGVD